MCKKNHEFVYDSHFKPFHQLKCCWNLIDNRADAPNVFLTEYDR